MPSPGPTASTVPPFAGSRSTSSRRTAVAPGWIISTRCSHAASPATFTNPAPLRSAAVAHNAAAPNIILLPPTTTTVPNVPLCPPPGRPGNPGTSSTHSNIVATSFLATEFQKHARQSATADGHRCTQMKDSPGC